MSGLFFKKRFYTLPLAAPVVSMRGVIWPNAR